MGVVSTMMPVKMMTTTTAGVARPACPDLRSQRLWQVLTLQVPLITQYYFYFFIFFLHFVGLSSFSSCKPLDYLITQGPFRPLASLQVTHFWQTQSARFTTIRALPQLQYPDFVEIENAFVNTLQADQTIVFFVLLSILSSGVLRRPASHHLVFIPQRPLMSLGTLRDQVRGKTVVIEHQGNILR